MQPKASFKLIYFYLVLLLFSTNLFSQNNDTTVAFTHRGYIKSYFKDTRDIFLSTKNQDARSIISVSIVAVGLGTLFYFDENIQSWSQENKTPTSEWFSKYVFEPSGSGLYPAVILASLYSQGLLFHNCKSKKVSLNTAKPIILSGVIAQVSKIAFRRERPYKNNGGWEWFKSTNDASFISGHTTLAFSTATMLALEYKKTIWVPILSYTLATGVALSRIHDNQHWASDVFGGGAIGYAVSYLIYKRNNWISVAPIVYKDGLGASFFIKLGQCREKR